MCSRAVLPSLLLVLLWGCHTLPAPPPAPVVPVAARSARWHALSEQGVVVVPPEGRTAPEWLLEELLAGLAALPASARRFPGGQLVIELRDEPAPFGMGDGSDAYPDWRDGLRRFVLYRYTDSQEPRASYRLERLSEEERERLWRRRAMVHAVIGRWDEHLRWSRRAAWARITGWRQRTASNSYDWAYSRKRGLESPALDFITFAEEALVPAESLRADAVPPDDQVRCQEFSKGHYLDGLLRALGGAPPRMSSSPADRGFACPAFDRWADIDELLHVEVLLSAPTGQRLQSLFGHLMLRPVYRQGSGRLGNIEPVMEIAAITGFQQPLPAFLARGVFGGYLNTYDFISMGSLRQEQLGRDERDVRRFPLSLSPAERLRLMERLWELERRGYHPYRFFSDNCASYLAFALDGALAPERLVGVGGLIVLPTGVLDSLARDNDPLIERAPDDLLSHGSVALQAEREQDAWLDELAAREPETARDWRAVRVLARSPRLEDRRVAYERLRALAIRTLERTHEVRVRELVLGIVDSSARMERFVAERAVEKARAVEQLRLQPPPGFQLPTTEELITERQVRYQREHEHDRIAEGLLRQVQLIRLLEGLPKRPPTAAEQETLLAAERARETFLEVTALYGDLYERAGAEPARPEALAAPWDRVRSGQGHWSVGPELLAKAEKTAPALMVRTSFLSERLGEQRQNGLSPLAEVRLLDGTTHWSADGPRPRLAFADVTVGRVRMMPQAPSVARETVLGLLGWGAEVTSRRFEDGFTEHRAYAEASIPLHASPRYERHVLVSVGPAGGLETQGLWPRPTAASVGSRGELSARLAGNGFALRADASWAPLWSFFGGTGWTHHLRAAAALEAPLPSRSLQLSLLFNADWKVRPQGVERLMTAGLLFGAR